jgi:hypothetical protein
MGYQSYIEDIKFKPEFKREVEEVLKSWFENEGVEYNVGESHIHFAFHELELSIDGIEGLIERLAPYAKASYVEVRQDDGEVARFYFNGKGKFKLVYPVWVNPFTGEKDQFSYDDEPDGEDEEETYN